MADPLEGAVAVADDPLEGAIPVSTDAPSRPSGRSSLPASATTLPTIESETLEQPSVFLDPVEFLTGLGTGATLAKRAGRGLLDISKEALRSGVGFQTFGLSEVPSMVRGFSRGFMRGYRGQTTPPKPSPSPEMGLLPPKTAPLTSQAPPRSTISTEPIARPLLERTPTEPRTASQQATISPDVVTPTAQAVSGRPGLPIPPSSVGAATPLTFAEQKIIAALKEAKPIRAATERLYSQERSERLGAAMGVGQQVPGEAGFKAQLGQLKGELPKARFEPIRGAIDEPTIDLLFNSIRTSPKLSGFEQITAQHGLAKLLGTYGVGVPTRGELELLGRIFSPEFVKTVSAKRGLVPRLMDVAAEVLAIPKTLMASFDLSAPLRQGVSAIAPFPKQWGSAFTNMFRYWGSERAYKAMVQEITARPGFDQMQRGKLALSALREATLTAREEQFMSKLPERIPVIGRIVRASDRAYTGFLTKLRADAFDELRRRASQSGVEETDALLQSMGKYVNAATGRGSLGQFEIAGSALSTAFFSPRLMASRFNLINPVFYARLEPAVRKEALKGALGTVALGMSVLGLAKAGGAQVGVDPRNADFGKIRVGNTRWDVWGGLTHFPRVMAQLISGQIVSSITGKTLTLGEGYKPLTRKDVLFRFFENKANPVVGFTLRMLEGRGFDGKPIEVSEELKNLVTPLFIQDLQDIYKEDPSLMPWATPGAFGVGVQTYGPKKKR